MEYRKNKRFLYNDCFCKGFSEQNWTKIETDWLSTKCLKNDTQNNWIPNRSTRSSKKIGLKENTFWLFCVCRIFHNKVTFYMLSIFFILNRYVNWDANLKYVGSQKLLKTTNPTKILVPFKATKPVNNNTQDFIIKWDNLLSKFIGARRYCNNHDIFGKRFTINMFYKRINRHLFLA